MRISILHQSPDFDSYRSARVKSMFNVEDANRFALDVELPVDETDWSIGLVIGPSGSGKTSIGREFFGPHRLVSPQWDIDRPIIDQIGEGKSFDEACAALSAVGLGSVPSWLRPYSALSNGERFRADLARILCDDLSEVVIDEFTSVVDRQVAKIGAASFGTAWRRRGGKAVLLSCHYDIAEWLQPDWVFDTASGQFSGRYLQRRPSIELDIHATGWSWWHLFEPHHYLKVPKAIAATCYVGFVDGRPVTHLAMSTRPGLQEGRACRFVVLPEWQGIGVGSRFLNAVCGAWRRGQNPYGKPMPTIINTSHPGLARSLRNNPLWTQISSSLHGNNKVRSAEKISLSAGAMKAGYGGHFRAIQGFRYIEGNDKRLECRGDV